MPALYDHASPENIRLQTLYALKILDTLDEERFNKIVQTIAQIFTVPIAGISFIGDNRVWFKSTLGITQKETPLPSSFEEKILSTEAPLIVLDAPLDPLFAGNELVAGPTHILSYAGVPITIDGSIVGVLFIADRYSRSFSRALLEALSNLTHWVTAELATKHENNAESLLMVQEELNIKNNDLQIANAKNQTILDSIGDGVIVINDKGEITFSNKQVEMLLGWNDTDLLGKLIFHAIQLKNEKGEEIPINDYPIRNAIYKRQKMVNNTLSYLKKDGSLLACATTASPIVISEVVIGGVIVFRDVSKEREVDRMKTEFISLASHQLRTPLSAMKWFSEMLIDGDVGTITDEQKEVVQNIYDSNERMIDLVNTLLNISRIESGRIIIDPKPTNLKKLVDEVVLELQPKLQAKKHSLAVSLHETMPEIVTDPKLIRHVYMNLLTNAIKYTPEGGQIIVMISKSGNEIISQISDNGFGIPKEQEDKVFTKFFRAKNIVGVETDGTGLGLYLTKAIVESSGGKIWFESEVGKGTTFWFVLPLNGIPARQGEVSLDS